MCLYDMNGVDECNDLDVALKIMLLVSGGCALEGSFALLLSSVNSLICY